MGSWSIRAEIHDDAGSENAVYAPPLAGLPNGYPLVMATVPVIDWNEALTTALRQASVKRETICYAAVMMIDPFTLWEDLADLLKEKGITGVINFPPASLLEGATPSTAGVSDNTLEMDRLKWFSDAGFRLVYAASDVVAIEDTTVRLEGLVDAFLYLPPGALGLEINEKIALHAMPDTEDAKKYKRPILTPISP